MERVLIFIVVTAATGISLGFAACSGNETKIPDAGDTGPADTGIDCGTTNVGTLHCREGAPNKACGSLDQAPVKEDPGQFCSMYKCKPGFVPVSMCACNAESNKVDAGADCPD